MRGVCACGFSLMGVCVVLVMYCVMVHGLWLCVLCVRVGVSFNVLVCGVGGLLFGVVWFTVVCVCVLCLFNVCALFVNVSNGVAWSVCMFYGSCLCVVVD